MEKDAVCLELSRFRDVECSVISCVATVDHHRRYPKVVAKVGSLYALVLIQGG